MPSRAVLPKPYQQPHPPLWVACLSPSTVLEAAERGLGALGVSGGTLSQQEKNIRNYHTRIRSCEPVGAFVNERISVLNFLFCHENDAYARETGGRMQGRFRYYSDVVMSVREVFPTGAYGTFTAPATGADSRDKEYAQAMGDPKTIIEVIKRWEAVGVEEINFMLNIGEAIPQEEVLASMRMFARDVMPAFTKAADSPQTAASAAAGIS
jgi:alkanesulfonate monooxygenase SsuD/methylene tetrahydromethanopterin reductase-like flavin-dependent oxidoreductase (luciferase family)